MRIEERIANAFGYEYCVLFPNARSAIAEYVGQFVFTLAIPSNVCPVLAEAAKGPRLVPVDYHTGMAPGVPVQLYGYREIVKRAELEIDPLMTGYFGQPFAQHSIISFGRGKSIDINGGGAFLTNSRNLAANMGVASYFPAELRGPLESAFSFFYSDVARRRETAELWDQFLGDMLFRIPREQIIPWRVIRRVPASKRNEVVRVLREAGIPVGTNYPPLPGVTDPGALQWGEEVINFWPTLGKPAIQSACELIEGVMWGK